MSKYLNIPQGNYKISVQDGGQIVLNPGALGDVVVTGNLTVQGATTTLETTDSVIEDNIILLNRGETGLGVTRDSGASGIRIDRGNLTDAQWLFVEDVYFTDTANAGTVDEGAWSARDANGRIIGIETVSIVTPGTNLNLLGQYTGPGGNATPNPGKLTVSGTGGNYQDRITDDDDIPNKKYVDDAIVTYLITNVPDRIEEGIIPDALTKVEVKDNSVTGDDSRAEIIIDGTTTQEWRSIYTDLYGIRIEQTDIGTEIKTVSTAENDLILSATGTGSVVVEDNLRIARIGHEGDNRAEPDAPTDGVMLYTDNSNAGATGVYFANEDGQRDELISRNRALVYSMLF
jgi:hypothetical protein